MGSSTANRKLLPAVLTVTICILTTAAAGATRAAAAAAATSLWAVAYSVEYRDAGSFQLVYAGYLRPVTAGRPAPRRIETFPQPNAFGRDSAADFEWPAGIHITARELAAALQRGHGSTGSSPPPLLDEVSEGTVLLVLATPPQDGPTGEPVGDRPRSLILLNPLIMFIDPEGTAYRRQLVEGLLAQLSASDRPHSSGFSADAPPKSPPVPSAGPGS